MRSAFFKDLVLPALANWDLKDHCQIHNQIPPEGHPRPVQLPLNLPWETWPIWHQEGDKLSLRTVVVPQTFWNYLVIFIIYTIVYYILAISLQLAWQLG